MIDRFIQAWGELCHEVIFSLSILMSSSESYNMHNYFKRPLALKLVREVGIFHLWLAGVKKWRIEFFFQLNAHIVIKTVEFDNFFQLSCLGWPGCLGSDLGWKIPTFFFNPSLSRVQFANILGAILFVQAGQGCYSYARIEDIRIIGLIAHIGMFIVDGIDRNYYSCNSFQILVPDNRLTPE